MLRRLCLATSLLAGVGCVVSPPPPQQTYGNYPPQPLPAPPPTPVASRPQPPPPPQPQYTPPEGDGSYVNIDEVPPNESAPSADVFIDALAPYGQWASDPSFGTVWTPSDPNYRPYHNGYWQMTDYGWTWIPTEPFGWAVTHYGRWFWNGRWRWRPDNVWGPAWVSWRESDGYVGWAPLPPSGAPAAPEEHWHFVPATEVARVDLPQVYVNVEPRVVYRSSRPLVRYTRTPRGEIFVAGPDPDVLRARYRTIVVPSALPPRQTGRFQEDAWRDRRLREERRAAEEREWQRQREERLRVQGEELQVRQQEQRLEQRRRQFEEQQRRARDEAERRRLADEQRRLEDEQRRLAEQRRRQDDGQRRFMEEQRQLQDQQRAEARRQAEQ